MGGVISNWPILPRGEIVDRVLEHLEVRPRRAVLLRGPSGIGKTTIAARVAASATRGGFVVAPIVALDSLKDVPLGALAPILASQALAEQADTGARYQHLLALLGAHSNEYLLVVDDAPLLDEVSAAGIYQLVRVIGVRCVLTARDGHAITGPLARLMHEDLITEVELAALSFEQSAQLLHKHFGETVQPDSVRALFESSDGNPMFLRELSFAAQRASAVHAGPHGLEIKRTQLPGHMFDGVSQRLDLLSDSSRELAELIAVAQLWPREYCDDDALDELLTADVADLSTERERAFVRLSHPLIREALEHGLPSNVARQRRATAGERLLSHPLAPVRFSGVRLAEIASTEQLEWAAGYAWAAGDHLAAIELGTKAIAGGGGFDAHLAVASALSARGRFDEAIDHFTHARDSACDEQELAIALSRWGQLLAFRLHAPAEAVLLVGPPLAEIADATARAILVADVLKWELMAGKTVATNSSGVEVEPTDAPGVLSLSLGNAMMHTMSGRVDEAKAAVAAGRPFARQLSDVIPHATSLFDLNDFLILIAEGRTPEATEIAAAHRLEPYTEAAGLWSYALALVHQQRGELARASELAALAVEQLVWRDFTGLVGVATALHATLLAQQGHREQATELLDSLAPALLDDPKVVLQTGEARAWLLVAEGDPEAAAAQIKAAGSQAIALGHSLLATLTLVAAVRFGVAAEVLELLDHVAEASNSRLMRVAALYARTSAAADAVALEAVAVQLHAVGLGSSAVAALVEATRLHERAGHAEHARRAGIALAAMRATGQDDGVHGSRLGHDLTEREFEVAMLAARRVRSKQIAEQLELSTRTVDNHLARIYRKLGITSRAALEQAMFETPQWSTTR